MERSTMNVIELQGVSKSYGGIAWYGIGDDDGNLPLQIACKSPGFWAPRWSLARWP